MRLTRSLINLARAQHGLVTLNQLREAGVSPSQAYRMREQGLLERIEPRLYRFAGYPSTYEQQALAACLSAGPRAVVSHRTAAVLWGLLPQDDGPIHVSVARPRAPRGTQARVHRSTDIVRAHRTVLNGIPVTTVARTLTDLGASVPDWEVEDAVDRGIAGDLVTVTELGTMLDAVARQGRRGVGALRRSLVDIVDEVESVLEAKLVRLILRSTLPRPEIQHTVVLGPNDSARIDVAYPELRIAIEADGRGAHIDRHSFQRDRDRQNQLQQRGWLVLRFTWHDVTKRPAFVLQTIRDARAARTRSGS